ncbi:hypothetical protein HRbin27_00215 [bacterium HR27]|nr:hypothetical protein HRbin27_00215 [bacterium HR27]
MRHVAADPRQHLPHLLGLLPGRLPDLPLRVEAEPLDPLPEVGEERPGLVQAHVVRIGEEVERVFGRHPGIEQPVLRLPERPDRRPVLLQRFRYPRDVLRHDHVRLLAQVRQQHRAGTQRAAMALVLRILRAADPLLEREGDVVERLHQFRVHRQVQRVAEIVVARRVEHERDRRVVVELAARPPEHSAHRIGQHPFGIRGMRDQSRVIWPERRVELPEERLARRALHRLAELP